MNLGFFTLVAACVVACHGPRAGSANDPARAVQGDTIIGTVQLVGTDPFPRTVILPANSGLSLRLIGPPTLQHVNGLEVQVVGQRAGDQFTVKSFLVVGANGQSATDGRLVMDSGTLYIVTEDGVRHALVNPSPNLRARVGQRVWVSGPLDREPIAYGFIE
jgi:hypothetical protein